MTGIIQLVLMDLITQTLNNVYGGVFEALAEEEGDYVMDKKGELIEVF